ARLAAVLAADPFARVVPVRSVRPWSPLAARVPGSLESPTNRAGALAGGRRYRHRPGGRLLRRDLSSTPGSRPGNRPWVSGSPRCRQAGVTPNRGLPEPHGPLERRLGRAAAGPLPGGRSRPPHDPGRGPRRVEVP